MHALIGGITAQMGHNWSKSVRSKSTRHCAVKELKSEWLHFSQPHFLFAAMWLAAFSALWIHLKKRRKKKNACVHVSRFPLNDLLLMLRIKNIWRLHLSFMYDGKMIYLSVRVPVLLAVLTLPSPGPALSSHTLPRERSFFCLWGRHR